MKGEVTGEWERILNVEVHALYSTPHTIWVMKSRRMTWAGNVARMGGERRSAYRVLVGKLRERDGLEY
jgi:hypothetical protein